MPVAVVYAGASIALFASESTDTEIFAVSVKVIFAISQDVLSVPIREACLRSNFSDPFI